MTGAGRVLEDRWVLVEVVDVVAGPAGALVTCRHSLGDVATRWAGELPAKGGQHHVEWTIDRNLVWGRDALPSPIAAPGLRMDGSRVVLRGRLEVRADNAATLRFGDDLVPLDLTGAPGATGMVWAEVTLPAGVVVAYPYEL